MLKALALAVSIAAASYHAAQTSQWGNFRGRVVTEWLPDGRKMRLVEDFAYTDPRGTLWVALKGDTIDGASIPRVFWSYIGGPFEGKYRDASVVHDVACDRKTRTWQSTHLMFYQGVRRGGVGLVSGKIMYGAVYHFGPRWAQPLVRALRDDADFLRMREYIQRNPDISLEAIERLSSSSLREAVPDVPQPLRIPPT